MDAARSIQKSNDTLLAMLDTTRAAESEVPTMNGEGAHAAFEHLHLLVDVTESLAPGQVNDALQEFVQAAPLSPLHQHLSCFRRLDGHAFLKIDAKWCQDNRIDDPDHVQHITKVVQTLRDRRAEALERTAVVTWTWHQLDVWLHSSEIGSRIAPAVMSHKLNGKSFVAFLNSQPSTNVQNLFQISESELALLTVKLQSVCGSEQLVRPPSASASASASASVQLFADDAELARHKDQFRQALTASDKTWIADLLRACSAPVPPSPVRCFADDYQIVGIIHRLESKVGVPRVLLARERRSGDRVAVKLVEREVDFEDESNCYDILSSLNPPVTVKKVQVYPSHVLVLEHANPLRTFIPNIDADQPLPFLRLFSSVANLLHTMHLKRALCHNDFHVGQVLVHVPTHGTPTFLLTDMDSVTVPGQPLPTIHAQNRKYLAPEVRCMWRSALARPHRTRLRLRLSSHAPRTVNFRR